MKQRRWSSLGLTALTYIIAFLVFFPIFWMILTSFKTEGDAFAFPPQIVFQPTLDNWEIALVDSNFISHLTNTLIITLISTGIALGLVVVSRPLTRIAVAFPFLVWSVVRLLRALAVKKYSEQTQFWPQLKPLVALAVPTLLLSLLVPIYNNAATGDPRANLYTLVWWYDEVGFGECCGRRHLQCRSVDRHKFDDL